MIILVRSIGIIAFIFLIDSRCITITTYLWTFL